MSINPPLSFYEPSLDDLNCLSTCMCLYQCFQSQHFQTLLACLPMAIAFPNKKLFQQHLKSFLPLFHRLNMMTSSKETFPRNWPFVRGIHRSPVNSSHKGQWRGALMFPLICTWINGWAKHRQVGNLRRHSAHYDVTVMNHLSAALVSIIMLFCFYHLLEGTLLKSSVYHFWLHMICFHFLIIMTLWNNKLYLWYKHLPIWLLY